MIEEKQNYLRENILEKGYDVNQFIEYLQTKKKDGADVANWTLEELKELVPQFISFAENGDIEDKDINKNVTKNEVGNNEKNQKNASIPSSNKNPNDPSSGLKDEDFGIEFDTYLKCQKIEKSDLNKYKDLKIKILSYKKVDNGFFSKTFFTFQIETIPLKLNVNRRYSDFDWLREKLSILYNTNILPRLSKKGKVVEERKINRRIRDLENFLNHLLKDPLIKYSQIFFDFLSIDNDEEFHKRKKVYDKMKTPSEPADVGSLTGKLKVSVDGKKEKFLEYIKDNSAFNETAFKKLDQNFKYLKSETNTLINRIESFGPLCDKLIKISTKYYDSNVIIESYKQIKSLFENWSNVLKKQSNFFHIDMKEYFKSLCAYYHHSKELVTIVEGYKSNYYKVSKNLITKKIELYKRQDTEKWELELADRNNLVSFYNNPGIAYKKICIKETNGIIKVKEKYGYYLNRMISEYERMRSIIAVENKQKAIFYSKKQQDILSEYIQKVGGIIEVMDGLLIKEKEEYNIEKDKPKIEIENLDNIDDNNDDNIDGKENEEKNKGNSDED